MFRAYKNGAFVGQYETMTELCLDLKLKWRDVNDCFNDMGFYCLGERIEIFTNSYPSKFEERLRQLCILSRQVKGSSKIIEETIVRLMELKKGNKENDRNYRKYEKRRLS